MRPLCGLSEACLLSSYGLPKATLGILDRLQTPTRGFKPFPAPLAYSCIAGLPPLFLWASEGDVKHFAPPSNPRPRLQTLPSAFGLLLHRRPASSLLMGFQKRRYAFCTAFKLPPATSNPSQRLWPTPASQPCLRQPGAPQRLWPTPASQTCLFSSYGLPKATLGILRRLQTLPRGFKPFPAPLAYSCIAALPAPAGSLGREPLERAARALQPQRLWPTPASQACLFSSYGRPKATLGKRRRPIRPSAPFHPLCGLSEACLLSSYGLPKATLGILDRLRTLLGSWQACCGLSVACPKPASSLLMGFRRRR